MRTKVIIIEAININTCAEYKPQINIRHIINVMIDDANKHIDAYRNIHRSYSIKSKINLFDFNENITYNITDICETVG
jgi:hypothetical protein